MTNIDIGKVFPTRSTSVHDLFNANPGRAFYIPSYQREYSWRSTDVEQLLEDVSKGISSFGENEKTSQGVFKFLGTLILVTEKSPHINIDPKDKEALPTKIDRVIDGQQRISTLSLIATQIHERLRKLQRSKFLEDAGLRDVIVAHLIMLQNMFSVDLRRGQPKLKPIVIRGSEDFWTLSGNLDSAYVSPMANFIAKSIEGVSGESYAQIKIKDIGSRPIGSAVRDIRDFMDDVVNAHKDPDIEFPPAWEIIQNFKEDDIWTFERAPLRNCLLKLGEKIAGIADTQKIIDVITKDENDLATLVQILALNYFILHRCCFTVIEPESEEWAFDMFQSLNGTGTPLTAIETFKPSVVNSAIKLGLKYEDSKYESCYSPVDGLFKNVNSAADKSKLTNDFLSCFALLYDGTKLGNSFSEQRTKLMSWYDKSTDEGEKLKLLKMMGNLATYWNKYNLLKTKEKLDYFDSKILDSEKNVVNMCQLYLISSNHTISNTILGYFYGDPNITDEAAKKDFSIAVKAVAAYYTLWRSSRTNNKLDSTYRQLFKDYFAMKTHESKADTELLLSLLREHLASHEIGNFNDWFARAKRNFDLSLAGKPVCKFALIIYSHDTVIKNPPLIEISTPGVRNLLNPGTWNNTDYSTIEHIAPQNPAKDSSWDQTIYIPGSELYNSIGNLTLLPVEINSSASNKNWTSKWYYYKYLSSDTKTAREQLNSTLLSGGITLSEGILKKLNDANYSEFVKPIVSIDKTSEWDAQMIEQRTKNICEIVYARLSGWLGY